MFWQGKSWFGMKKWWFLTGFWLLASRGSGGRSKVLAWALFPAFLKFSKILFFSNRKIFCKMGMICLKKHPNLTPWLTIGNPIETNAFAGLTECAIPRHKTCSSCRIFFDFQILYFLKISEMLGTMSVFRPLTSGHSHAMPATKYLSKPKNFYPKA